MNFVTTQVEITCVATRVLLAVADRSVMLYLGTDLACSLCQNHEPYRLGNMHMGQKLTGPV